MGITNQSTDSSTRVVHGVIKRVKAIIQVCGSQTDIICCAEDIKDDLPTLPENKSFTFPKRITKLVATERALLTVVCYFRAELAWVQYNEDRWDPVLM